MHISMDYMYAACSTTARRGALDWAPVFEKANKPVFEALYKSVRDGTETRKSLEFNNRSTYRKDLEAELAEIDSQEIWRAGTSRYFKGDEEYLIISYRQDCQVSASGLQAIVVGCLIFLYILLKIWTLGRRHVIRIVLL